MSPRRRPNGYYQFRKKLPGIGVRARTLGTKNRAIATRRAAALDTLVERGRMDLVRAWLDGRLDLVQLVEAYESGRIDRLTRELNRANIPTLAAACDLLLRLKAPDVRPSSLKRYAMSMVPIKAFFGPDTPVDDVLATEPVGQYKLDRSTRAKPKTVNSDLQVLSALARMARDEGWIADRPKIVQTRVAPKTIPISAAEQAAYLAALRPPFRPIMAFLLATGCRRGEAERLTVDDLTRLGDGSWWATIGESKTPAGVRTVPIPRDTARYRAAARGPHPRGRAPGVGPRLPGHLGKHDSRRASPRDPPRGDPARLHDPPPPGHLRGHDGEARNAASRPPAYLGSHQHPADHEVRLVPARLRGRGPVHRPRAPCPDARQGSSFGYTAIGVEDVMLDKDVY